MRLARNDKGVQKWKTTYVFPFICVIVSTKIVDRAVASSVVTRVIKVRSNHRVVDAERVGTVR